jgi:hypothetical protein
MEEPAGLLETTVLWSALSDVRLAVLGRRLAVQLCGYPELYAALIDRMSQRSARLATSQAISQMTKVDRRLLDLFWHLAERWGRITAAGVHVPLRISHRLLGQLIGARRPTISAAVGQLADSGDLVRRADSTWLLTGDPGALRGGEGVTDVQLLDDARQIEDAADVARRADDRHAPAQLLCPPVQLHQHVQPGRVQEGCVAEVDPQLVRAAVQGRLERGRQIRRRRDVDLAGDGDHRATADIAAFDGHERRAR